MFCCGLVTSERIFNESNDVTNNNHDDDDDVDDVQRQRSLSQRRKCIMNIFLSVSSVANANQEETVSIFQLDSTKKQVLLVLISIFETLLIEIKCT